MNVENTSHTFCSVNISIGEVQVVHLILAGELTMWVWDANQNWPSENILPRELVLTDMLKVVLK